jgi:hypothetical protein
MVDANPDKIYIFQDGTRASIVVGKEQGDLINGSFRGAPLWNPSIRHHNFKQTLCSQEMTLHCGYDDMGRFKPLNKKLVIVNYFLDGELHSNSMSPANVRNEQLQTLVKSQKTLIQWFREKLFSLTGQDLMQEALQKVASNSAAIRKDFRVTDDHSNYYPYSSSRYNLHPSIAQTSEEN